MTAALRKAVATLQEPVILRRQPACRVHPLHGESPRAEYSSAWTAGVARIPANARDHEARLWESFL